MNPSIHHLGAVYLVNQKGDRMRIPERPSKTASLGFEASIVERRAFGVQTALGHWQFIWDGEKLIGRQSRLCDDCHGPQGVQAEHFYCMHNDWEAIDWIPQQIIDEAFSHLMV